jgi:NAD(P) transhydrogenase subunit alpha
VVEHGVTLIGAVNVPSSVPFHASQMYGRNILTLLQHLVKDGQLAVDEKDEIAAAMLVVHGGKVRV